MHLFISSFKDSLKIIIHFEACHEAREKMIEQSSLKWTIVRSATLTNGKHKAIYRSGEEVKSKGFTATISRADVADFMLKQINDKSYLQKKPRIMY